MTNAAGIIRRHAEATPNAPALIDGDRRWSYRELDLAIAAAAEELSARGLQRGQRLLLVVPTVAEFVFTYYAAHALGATVVSVNTLSTAPELAYYVEDAECSMVVTWFESAEASEKVAQDAGIPVWVVDRSSIGQASAPHPIADTAGDDPAVILYTSGTTGKPKGAVLAHDNLVDTGECFVESLESSQDERMGTALPLFHVFGQVSVMCTTFTGGGSLYLVRPFDGAAMLELAAREKLTALAGVPTMWIAMLHAETDLGPEDFTQLRLACSGGAAMPLEVAKAFQARFGAVILDGYGLSETSGAATTNQLEGVRKDLSVGRPLPRTTITVLDELHNPVPLGEVGEIAMDGPMVMKEYWGRPEATKAAKAGRFFLTGDLGRMDEDGYVWIVDRKKDLVIRGGYNVYPREVEEELFAHPQVKEAAVIGLPDDTWGEEVAAVVAPKPGEDIDVDALRAWLHERISPYKVPRIYHLVDDLPKGATGKILKRGLDRDEVRTRGIRAASPEREARA
ncbi:MAG: AMP-binding protein [Mobilicoccus sp.]|nr:AMP-binding protein [Mobilicoccus sp.]